jgi:iron(III) transport system substrate-binding protein
MTSFLASNRSRRTLAVALAAGVLVAACGGDDADTGGTTTVATTTTTATGAPTTQAATTTTAPTMPEARTDIPLVIYSGRHYGVEPVYADFTAKTGIKVEVVAGADQANLERLRVEGERSPADLLLTADTGTLALAADEGLLRPFMMTDDIAAIPEPYRDGEDRWTALSLRARTIYVNPDAVAEADRPTSYADLADPVWKDRVCLRPATHVYTQSWASFMIQNLGEERATEVISAIYDNSTDATRIDSDTKIIETLAAGGCDVAIANTYYLGRFPTDVKALIVWPEQGAGEPGVHLNASGAGIAVNADNPGAAQLFLAYMAGELQEDWVNVNSEYPANPNAPVSPTVAAWGAPRFDERPLGRYGETRGDALIVLARAGYR